MISAGRAVSVWAFPDPADLRKGYNGLYGLVKQGLGRDPLSVDMFLFVNRKRSSCKVLVWDGTGLCILAPRARPLRSALASGARRCAPADDNRACTLHRGLQAHRQGHVVAARGRHHAPCSKRSKVIISLSWSMCGTRRIRSSFAASP